MLARTIPGLFIFYCCCFSARVVLISPYHQKSDTLFGIAFLVVEKGEHKSNITKNLIAKSSDKVSYGEVIYFMNRPAVFLNGKW